MSIVIRKVDTGDLAVQLAIRDMDKECFPTDAVCNPAEGVWWVALDGAVPVGYAGISQSKQWSNAGYLCRAGVLRSHRGQGLQKRLIKARLAYAKRFTAWNWVVTDCARKNVESANALISCGFRLYNPSFLWSFETALYWRIKLA